MYDLPDSEDSKDGFEINMLPMIDVIFAILTFFVISVLRDDASTYTPS